VLDKRFKTIITLCLVLVFITIFLCALVINGIIDVNFVATTKTSFQPLTDGFTIAWITDTQLNSQDDTWGTFADYLLSVKDSYNIEAVVHTGDIVENGSAPEEWEVANTSMGVLLDNDVPYCWLAGNHDWNRTLMGEYLAFNSVNQESETYWYSSYGNCSTAIEFTYENHSFIIVCVEFLGDSGCIAWLTNILDNNADKNILVATHSYLNATGGYGDQWGETWGNAFKNLLYNHPNVFATINGHWASLPYHQTVNNRTEIMTDYMNADFMVVTYLSFDVNAGRVYVRTYNHQQDEWYTAGRSEFNFDVDFL
jgi:3',5'-cyclic AMP phosphodiesterase CpdA